MTIIRDINGNRTKHGLGHLLGNVANAGHWHQDSTGLYVVDYITDSCGEYSAFIRPENTRERNAVEAAKAIGSPRP